MINTKKRVVTIVANPRSIGIKEAIRFVIKCLNKHSVEILIEGKVGDFIKDGFELAKNLSHINNKVEICERSDFVIVLGGDGTMLYAANIVAGNSIPILGIHMGRLGFITPFDQEEISQVVDRAMSGDLPIQKRMRLSCEIIRDGKVYVSSSALNEVTLNKTNLTNMIYFSVRVNNQLVSDYRADGYIVAAPTGSTGYALSVGGPIVEPTMDLILLAPISNHSITTRNVIVSAKSVVEVSLNEKHQAEVLIFCDGQIVGSLEHGDKLSVRKSKFGTHLYHEPERTFFDHLGVKFGWGRG